MVVGEPERGSSTASPTNVAYRIDRLAHRISGQWLDFGCADGGYDEEILARGAEQVYGVDVEADRIASAKLRALPNARYYTFDGRTLPFPDEQFDGVFMNEVFEHVADEGQALGEARRVLKPGGCLALISPNRWFPFEGHGARIFSHRIGYPTPLIPWLPTRLTRSWTNARNYWPGELVGHVRSAGFTIDELGFIWPVFESYPWLPPRALTHYQRHFRSWDHKPVIRRLGVSTMVIGIKPDS